jgi:EAL domain-containing protein (putative c-di-GMP-specific phosphodiesterase class I)
MLNVNLSARQLGDPELVDRVITTLEATGFDPTRLVLEITENALIEDIETAVRQLEALRTLGIRIALDDFGMGHSSLRHLAKLPVDVLKIDRLFVQALAREEPEGDLVGVVVQLAEAWGLDLVAEGIEDLAELTKLRAVGCTIGQGFYFGRPVSGIQAQHAIAAESTFAIETIDVPLG